MGRPGGSAVPEGPRWAWTYQLTLTPFESGQWEVLWVAQRSRSERRIWDHWWLSATAGARTAASIASDTWVAATELCERQQGA